MKNVSEKNRKRQARIRRIRAVIFGTSQRPRLVAQKTNRYLKVQVIDDVDGKTLLSATDKAIKAKSGQERAIKLGDVIGKKLLEKKIKAVVFDRRGFKYHGKIQALAEAVRKTGVKF